MVVDFKRMRTVTKPIIMMREEVGVWQLYKYLGV